MNKQLEEKLENIKMYIGITFIVLLLLDIFLMAAAYSKYGSVFSYNESMNHLIVGLIIATVVSLIVFFVLRIILRKQQGDMYITLGDMFGTIGDLLLPSGISSKIPEVPAITLEEDDIDESLMEDEEEPSVELQQNQEPDLLGNREEMKSTVLWKAAANGIHVWNLVKAILLLSFGSAILYVVIGAWKDMDDQRILLTIIGGLFIIVLYFWGVVCAIGVKKRADDVLQYVFVHQVPFKELNADFTQADKCGNGIYKGEKYIFLDQGKGMQVAAIKDITECKVLRMAGRSPRRLFLAYYILTIATEKDTIMKYGMNPAPFYKLRDMLQE